MQRNRIASPNSGGAYNSTWPGQGDDSQSMTTNNTTTTHTEMYVTYETCSIASSDTNHTTTTVRRRRRKVHYDHAIQRDGAFSMFAPTASAVNLCVLTSSGISPTTAELDSLDARKCKRVTAKQTNVGKVRTVVPRSQSANEPRGSGSRLASTTGRLDIVTSSSTRSHSSQPRVRKAGRGRFVIEMNSDDETDVWLIQPQLGPSYAEEEVSTVPEMDPLPLNAHDEAIDDHAVAGLEEMWLAPM